MSQTPILTVGIDARELTDRPAGKGQYLSRIVQQWMAESRFRLLFYIGLQQTLPADFLPPGSLHQVISMGGGPFWHRRVAKRLAKDGVQVFFAALSYQSAVWNDRPTVTVIHDLAVFRVTGIAHNRRAQVVEKVTLRRCARRSAKLVAVSESTKRDLLFTTQVPAEKVAVIPEAALLNTSPQQPPLTFTERSPYFLFVGTLEPRKNIATLLSAYAALPEEIRQHYALKLAGKPGWGKQDYPDQTVRLGIQDRVEFLGYVPDADLPELYAKATLFLYPSWYEGFGLPIIEAMSVGTPVVSSLTSSMPEVVGEGGICCDPADAHAITRAITALLEPESYARYSTAAYQQAKAYRWEEIAEAVAQQLEAAVR